MIKFNEQLRLLRQEWGFSQQELADRIGISKSSINMYERGEREPGIDTLKRIAAFYNVDIDFLLGKTSKRRKGLILGARIDQNIAHNIQHHRQEANLSQKQFADLLGVEEDTVVNLENGKQKLDKEMLYKICDVLVLIPRNIVPLDDEGFTEDEEYLYSRRQNSPDQIILTEGEQELLNLFRRVPEENRALVLEMIRAAVKTQG